VAFPLIAERDVEVVTQSFEFWLSIWKVFLADRGKVDVSEREGLAFRHADGLFRFWNFVVLTETYIGAERLLDRLRQAVY
jgi:hypothetical protein